MASGWYSQTEGDVLVTVATRFFLNGAEVILPRDWSLNLTTEGNHVRVTVEREGQFLPLADALALAQMLMTSSRKELKQAVR